MPFITLLVLLLTSFYAPLQSGKKGNYKDSTLTVYQYNFEGIATGKQEIKYKSARKTIIEECIFVPIKPLALND